MKKQITFFTRYFGLKFTILLFALLFLSGQSIGQVNISIGNPVNQDFNSIGTSAVATLPTGWKASLNSTARTLGPYSTAVATTTYNAGNAMSTSSSYGIYNFGAGIATSATDRAIGGISTSNAASKSVNIYLQLSNNGALITDFTISYAVEKYRNGLNTAGFSIQMYYSTDGTTWTSAGSNFLTSIAADADNNGFTTAPGTTINVTSKTLPVSVAASAGLYIAWNYSVTSGTTTSNAQALGIDDISIVANGSSTAVAPTVTTGTTTFITQSSAISAGNVTNDGGGTITTRGICYGTLANPDTSGAKVSVSGTTGAFTANLVILAASTIYHYRAYAANSVGYSYGADSTFTTTSGAIAPALTYSLPNTITDNSAVFGGNISSDGGSAILSRGTVWSTTSGVTLADNYLAEGGTTTGVFSHARTSLPSQTQIFYKAFATNAIGTTMSLENSFYTLSVKPIAHVTDLTATAVSTTEIDLSWTPVSADGFLIIKKLGANAPTGIPADATAYALGAPLGDGTIAADVSIPTAQITGLSPMTQYSFTVIPYNYDGSNFQTYSYYTVSLIPSASDTTFTPPSIIYTWNASVSTSGSYTDASSWFPSRITPAANDILQFNNGLFDTITGIPSETIGQLLVTNNTTVYLKAATPPPGITYNIGGNTGTDLLVALGSQLNIAGGKVINLKLLTTATASIFGTMNFTDTIHKIDAVDAGAIVFETGSTLTQGLGCPGNLFTQAGTPSVVLMKTGSTFIQLLGSNPFGLSAPLSKVVFEDGSLFLHKHTGTPSFSGRTYANFELNVPGVVLTTTGASAVRINNLKITAGTLNCNMTASPGHSIKGNITVDSAQSLIFAPASAGTINLNGTSSQTISGKGVIKTSSLSNLVINNTNGINVNDSLTIAGTITFTNGNLNLGANIKLDSTAVIAGTPSATSMIVPNAYKIFKSFKTTLAGNITFPIGEITPYLNYMPVNVNFTSATYAANNSIGLKVVASKNSNDLSTTNYLNRYWELEQNGISAFTANANFQYATTDVTGNEALIYCKNFSILPILVLDTANSSSHQLNATGITQLGAFGGGEDLSNIPTISTPVPTSLSGFATNPGTPSGSQTFTVGGIHLTNDLVVNAPVDYEVRDNGIGLFGASVTFTPSSGTVATKTIEVRIAASATVGSPSGNVSCSSIGVATTQYVAVSGTVTSAPIIAVTGSLTAFANTAINTYSAEQSYTVQGSNLTANIIITPAAGFEISSGTGGGFTPANPLILTQAGGTVVATPVYIRFAPTAVQAYIGNISNASSGATQLDIAVNGAGVIAEPTNHATAFTVSTGIPSGTTVNLSWIDAVGGTLPDGYLIKGSTIGYSAIVTPTDGSPEADGGLVKNIPQGVGSYQFTGLTPSTQYYFKIIPYTNSGTAIDYKTTAVIPQDTALTSLALYTWNVSSGKWNVASSWTPNRDFPSASDVLVFDGTTFNTPDVTIDFTSPQSIGKLRIINNANVKFSTSYVPRTLNIGYPGFTSPQLEIETGAALTVKADSALTLNLPATYIGSISGNVTFQNAAHKLTAATASGITFNSGAVFTADTLFKGNPFGTTTANSVVFGNGSTYIYVAGSNPFVLSQPSSVVVFQTGSLYKHKSTGTPSFSGRTYGDFEVDAPGLAVTVTASAASNINNLTVTNGTFNYNVTGTPGHSIKGNISVAAGQTLNFAPTATATINLNGTSGQTISGDGTLTIGPNANFIVKSNVDVLRNLTFGGNLTIDSAKSVYVFPNMYLSVNGSLTNNAGISGLIISADGTGSASLIHSSAGVNATVNRFIPHYFTDEFHMLGSPVAAQAIAPLFNEPDGFYAWNELLGDWAEYASTASFAAANNGQTNFIPGKGYAVSYPFQTMKSFEGVLNQGTVNIPVTTTISTNFSGFNFVANPYPSAINWDATTGWFRDILDNPGNEYAMWIWNPIEGTYGTYISNTDLGLGIGIGTSGVTSSIPLAQGFWVKSVNTLGGTLSMTDAVRIHSSQVFLKSTSTTPEILRLKVTGTANPFSDEFVLRFGNANDQNGAEKMFSMYATAPALYATKNNKNWTVNNLTTIAQHPVVPISFKAGADGNYTIHAANLNSFSSSTYIYLKDLKTNVIKDLTQNANYTFAATTNDFADRFQLIFASSPLEISNKIIQNTSIYSYENTIFVAGNEAIKQISVYNTLGQLIKNYTNMDANCSISMKGNAAAYYVVKVISSKNVYTEKVFIK
jgi:hypothetical protein